jgi:rubrerythrin
MVTPNLLDAIAIVKENEKTASESYAGAAQKITNPIGKLLFQQLSQYEQFHYAKLIVLETSLKEKGEYIDYEGKEFPLPPKFEFKAAQDPASKSVMSIITAAVELELQAERTYADLSARITDPQGHAMFSKLSEEEHRHYRLLMEAYWSLNNLGTWMWYRP